MAQYQRNALSPPKSPYQQFIEENDKLLNSISQNDIQSQETNDSDFVLRENDSGNEYYESLKESLDSINAKLGIVPKSKIQQKSEPDTVLEKSTDNSIAQFASQSDILPSDKVFCPSPLDKQNKKEEEEEKWPISTEKDKSSGIGKVISNSELIKSDNDESAAMKNESNEDQYSRHSNKLKELSDSVSLTPQLRSKSRSSAKASKSSKSNNDDLISTPTKASQSKSNQISTPQIKSVNSFVSQKNDNSSVVSRHSQASKSKKSNSVANDNIQTPISPKANSESSNNNQVPTPQKDNSVISDKNQAPSSPKAESVFSKHSQTPNNQKGNSIISSHSQTTGSKKGSSSGVHRSMISTSYIDYLDAKQKRILEKWRQEDLEEERNLEEEMIDRLLTPKHTWKTFKFTSPRPTSSKNSASNTEANSNLNDEDETDRSIFESKQTSGGVFAMPPNPSANLKQMLEIPAIERLLTPKKNFILQSQQQRQQKTKRQNSTRPRKIKPTYEDDFINRQAHYENEKRLKNTMKTTNKPKTKKKGDDVFNKLYEKSLVDDSDSSDFGDEEVGFSGDSEKRNKVKWSNKSHLVESKKIADQQPPMDTSKFRDDRYSPNSRRIAQSRESRSFQERTSIDFDDVLKQNKEEQDQKKRKELYEQHMQNLE
ncbi:hypothetical protein M9Y10_025514 [Tritrichomonas musculus]|uniref:Uncharacterized protein n=1 Tax=Tritrichomonas musculus TaxID=1915356 RepID=A0ABR2H8W2_9EUKA